jgi:putative transposase
MSRPLRLELSGGLYHVTSRGDRREDIYQDDTDREIWLEILAQCCERYHWAIHAWCQMTNHYHLVVETPEANLSAGMRPAQWRLHPEGQSAPQAGGSRISRPLQGDSGRTR